MVSDKVYNLCRSPQSVSAELAKNPKEPPGEIVDRLFGSTQEHATTKSQDASAGGGEADLDRVFDCGNWGATKPSELFLKVCPSFPT